MKRVRDRYPVPTAQTILEHLNVAGASREAQLAAVAEAAYGGRLSLGALQAMRAISFLPYDTGRAEVEPAE
jgi:hypothetical protein